MVNSSKLIGMMIWNWILQRVGTKAATDQRMHTCVPCWKLIPEFWFVQLLFVISTQTVLESFHKMDDRQHTASASHKHES